VLITAWDALPLAHSAERSLIRLRDRLRPRLSEVLEQTHRI
jgi:hypothetical protein